MSTTSRWYILTLSNASIIEANIVFPPECLPSGVDYMVGQQEQGEGGFVHWQFCLHCTHSQRSSFVRRLYPSAHVEATRSDAAVAYCQKEDTRVFGSGFELGNPPVQRNKGKDWEGMWNFAKAGEIERIPCDVRIRCYSTLQRIAKDYLVPPPIERQVMVLYGSTGSGKSHRAWIEASLNAFPKDPNTKFWDGYRGHENVVIDEFRGSIAINHMLRWCDKYPVIVEVKGGAVALQARRIWITSNLAPIDWYPDVDSETRAALFRRLTIYRFDSDGKVYDDKTKERKEEYERSYQDSGEQSELGESTSGGAGNTQYFTQEEDSIGVEAQTT